MRRLRASPPDADVRREILRLELEAEVDLLQSQAVDVLVAKNSGGTAAYAPGWPHSGSSSIPTPSATRLM